jgi:probable F420-dependent oxidoreductase
MSRLGIGPVGISVRVAGDDGYLAAAAELEELGYAAIWLQGGQLDSLGRLAKLAAATRAVQVGAAVIPVDVYPAAAVSALHAELAASAPGRLLLALGGPQQPRPLAPLNAYLDELDGARPAVPAGQRILAALGPRKLALARERAAGAMTLLVTPAATAAARQALGERPALIVCQFAVLDSDAGRAREAGRGPLRFLSGVRGYRDNFARMGFTGADVAGLSDRLVDHLIAWGSADAIASRVSEHLEAGADQVALTVLDGAATGLAAARQLADVLPC